MPKAAITVSQASDLSGDTSSERKVHMNMHYIGHAIITALGFLMGAVFAMIVAPGDAMVLIGTGIVFGYFTRSLFDQNFGGDWFWPFGPMAGTKTLDATLRTGTMRPLPLKVYK